MKKMLVIFASMLLAMPTPTLTRGRSLYFIFSTRPFTNTIVTLLKALYPQKGQPLTSNATELAAILDSYGQTADAQAVRQLRRRTRNAMRIILNNEYRCLMHDLNIEKFKNELSLVGGVLLHEALTKKELKIATWTKEDQHIFEQFFSN